MPTSVEFKLLAPHNKAAVLIGSFSDWNEIPLQKDDKGYFRTSVELDDGVYQYKFRIQSKSWSHEPDEWVEINDPYVTEIDASTSNGVVRIKDGERIVDDYVWHHDDKLLPENHELVIYELLVSDFFHGTQDNHQGHYTNVIEKLDYLCELGINAIELMPVNESPGHYNWGYIPSYFFAPKPEYGSTQELKHLIDECHVRGIRVILDQLYNHSSEESPLLHIDRDYWYYHDRHHPDADPQDYWGPEFNYEYKDETLGIRPAWEFMGDVLRFWVQEYHIDGIRYDALKELDNFDFLHWMTEGAKQVAGQKPFYNIGEHIPEKPELISPNGPMDGCWHENFYQTLKPPLCGEAFDLDQIKQAIDPTQQDYPQGLIKAVSYLCNHDQKRLLLELGDRDILDDAAFSRAKLGAVLLMTAVGVPLIWMGEEFGDCTPINADEPDQQLGWLLLQGDRNRDLFEYYKGLIALRKQNLALQTANIDFFHENPEDKVFAYGRWNDQGARVVVVASFSDQFRADYQIPHFPANGTWHEWTKNYKVESQNDQLTINLGEYEAQVLIWQ
ncbi:alpha amylase C-terminal domain-containing protein [Leptolyngbya sp. FACHB-671]|uniref:alpha-amylase family glycosyl hydrolase n=1 Tax=Leptolyngbya sp. FACHB-671 TaxID=2692812 RepID=UPI0016835E6D|nr:alpha-amylase family glycosyl hydrolase [Leptolyngbya sp. FACHB-671]MBD2070110.1 alpha amylase C-terminal domain-containing protein [Leptolyngbya sp. FACHB-671]